MACGAEGGGAGSGAGDEPAGVPAETRPEAASLAGLDSGVAFACERRQFCSVIGGVLLGGSEPSLAGTAILNVIVEGFQVGAWNLGDGRGRELACAGGAVD